MSNPQAPVLLIGFNRPDLISQSLSKLLNSSRTIYISVDGPRHKQDQASVNQTTNLAEKFKQDQVNFGKVHLMFHETNLGCKVAVQSAIDWIFESEINAIVLEDDIFFTDEFLETMDAWLMKYENEKEIFHLNGFNPLSKKDEPSEAYLCRYTHVWGWATWKDRWIHYDRDLRMWDPETFPTLPGLIGQDLPDQFFTYWKTQIDLCLNGLDTWDVQWAFSQWVYGGFSLTPGSRLTGNQGFDARATHTQKSGNSLRERLPVANQCRFLHPSSPYLNLELNKLHDQIEHGILPKNDYLTSFTWRLKAFLARLYIRLLSNFTLHSIVNSIYSLRGPLKKFAQFSESIKAWIMKFFRYLYWRIAKPTVSKIRQFIIKCVKFAYWRGLEGLIKKKSS